MLNMTHTVYTPLTFYHDNCSYWFCIICILFFIMCFHFIRMWQSASPHFRIRTGIVCTFVVNKIWGCFTVQVNFNCASAWSNSEWQVGQAIVFQGVIEMCFSQRLCSNKRGFERRREMDRESCLSFQDPLTAVNLNKWRSCSSAPQLPPVPLWAFGREVNWQHLLSGRQNTPSPPLTHTSHIHTRPIGHLETPVWLQAPSDHT